MSGEEREDKGVTSDSSRSRYYLAAFTMSVSGILSAIVCLRLDMEHWVRYAIWGAVCIAYSGIAIRCWCKDVPVQTYRLEAKGRFRIFLVVMIYTYCISYTFQGVDRLVMVSFSWMLILAMIPIVQLSWPIEDFTQKHVYTMMLGLMYGFIGGIGVNVLFAFIVILVYSLLYLLMQIMRP
ncbi:unnamed protein product [Arabidopsis halleri]